MLMSELTEFVNFFKGYVFSRILQFGAWFEGLKDILVALLVVKRGKYSSSFLNTSFFILVASSVIAGPIIAENNPFVPFFEGQYQPENQSTVVSYNPSETALSTVISAKPRDKIVDYKVASGDTLASIARKFDVSVDTIKWANSLKNDTIKPNQVLKIPPVTGVVHKVASGDNIYTIAKKYNTSAQNIVNFIFNEFTDPDTFGLQVGQLVYVPDGVVPPEQPKYTAMAPSYAKVQAGVRGTSNFIWPTNGGITQYPTWYHMAIDIANNAHPPILAADTGTVTFAGCVKYGYGCHVVIDHANGYQSLYAHLSSIGVSAGQAVGQGAQIGVMGSTGRSTGTHLHFEVRMGGVLQNPQAYLK
ncbi:MAG: M23 family metallopeptidase [Patescibacteria group bacterium]